MPVCNLIDHVIHGTLEVVEDLVASGDDVNCKDENGMTPLLWAVSTRNIKILDLLISNGADVNAKENFGDSAMILVTGINTHIDIALHLIKHGIELDHQNYRGQTAIMCASKFGNKEIIKLLLDNGANINALDLRQRNALHWAMTDRDLPSIVRLLCEHGINVDQKNIDGETAADYAEHLGFVNSLEVLHDWKRNDRMV